MYCKSPKKLAHKNDILLSVRAPVGDVNIAEGTCCIGRGLAAISGQKEKSYSKYIYYYLLWKKKELENIGGVRFRIPKYSEFCTAIGAALDYKRQTK